MSGSPSTAPGHASESPTTRKMRSAMSSSCRRQRSVRTVQAGDSFSEVESTKSVSDIYAPVSGTVVAVNDDLADGPDALNSDPYGAGWICEIEMSDPADVEAPARRRWLSSSHRRLVSI